MSFLLLGAVCIVLGSEGTGLSREVRDACHGLLHIPSANPDAIKASGVDSLNVSVAAGVIVHAFLQR